MIWLMIWFWFEPHLKNKFWFDLNHFFSNFLVIFQYTGCLHPLSISFHWQSKNFIVWCHFVGFSNFVGVSDLLMVSNARRHLKVWILLNFYVLCQNSYIVWVDVQKGKIALQTTDTPTQANLIWWTLIHKRRKIGPEFWPTQRAVIGLGKPRIYRAHQKT